VGLDLVDGDDVLDRTVVLDRADGCQAIVHLASVEEEVEEPLVRTNAATGTADRVSRVNVDGTASVLAAASGTGVDRVVFLSSVDVLGCFMGQGKPRYFPIDDEHPADPVGAYAQSKWQAENLCEQFTSVSGSASICLRPPGVFDTDTYTFIIESRRDNPAFEWTPFWEYGAFLDIRDLVSAIGCSLSADLNGHHRLLVCATDISSSSEDGPTLARRLMPDVPFSKADAYQHMPYAALIDSSRARLLLDWEPKYTWRP
jgi:nucleoside-diphosphate-sugar epimerase